VTQYRQRPYAVDRGQNVRHPFPVHPVGKPSAGINEAGGSLIIVFARSTVLLQGILQRRLGSQQSREANTTGKNRKDHTNYEKRYSLSHTLESNNSITLSAVPWR